MRTPEKRIALLCLLVYYFLKGIGDYFVPDLSEYHPLYSIGLIIVGNLLLMRWFILDTRERNYRFSKPMFLMMVALTLVAAPIYFIQTRGKGFWKPVLKGLGFLCIGACVYAVGLEGTAYLHQLTMR